MKIVKRLRKEAEGYRRVAFPKGGAATIRTRDEQNRALVARGGYQALDELATELEAVELDDLEVK